MKFDVKENNVFVTFGLKIFVASRLSTGSDKDAIVAVLGARSNKQRLEIAVKYQQKYSKVKLIAQRASFPIPVVLISRGFRSRMATGVDKQAKRFELNFFIRKAFL